MENRINLAPLPNSYLQQFYVAQLNLSNLIREERLNSESVGVVILVPCSSMSISSLSSAGLVDWGGGCGVSSPTGLVDC